MSDIWHKNNLICAWKIFKKRIASKAKCGQLQFKPINQTSIPKITWRLAAFIIKLHFDTSLKKLNSLRISIFIRKYKKKFENPAKIFKWSGPELCMGHQKSETHGYHWVNCKYLFSNQILSDKMHIAWKLIHFCTDSCKELSDFENVSRVIRSFLINPQLNCFEFFHFFNGLLLWLQKKI